MLYKTKINKSIYHFMLGYIIICSVLFSTSLNAQKKDSTSHKDKDKPIVLNGKDGPYIINDTLYRVNAKNKLLTVPEFLSDSLVIRADNVDNDEFYLKLRSKYIPSKSTFQPSEKMMVISDIEGKYNAFSSFLFANQVIDENHNWVYGKGKLVLVGDFVDRGKNVTQVLWLIYKLEQQALKAGGKVHFILGNHEVLNFQGNHTYNRGKYIKVAQEISGKKNKTEAIKYIYSDQSELGSWLLTKNVIEKIGDYLFVHAGLSPEILDYKLSLEDINQKMRLHYVQGQLKPSDTTRFLYGSKGPIWYRGLVTARPQYSKIVQAELDEILNFYNAKKMVIGHSVVNTVSSDFKGKVIRVDVSHGSKKFSGRTKGLLIENGKEYVVDDKGSKTPLN
ncbi:metallophosphoesterase [Croceitalea sp. MTPC5]|uniref:metallophosphoesterase n=1 Tax=Croceitalea sp. MTPC5 TaxID=3056565 RepID=UPI0030CFAAAD